MQSHKIYQDRALQVINEDNGKTFLATNQKHSENDVRPVSSCPEIQNPIHRILVSLSKDEFVKRLGQ